MYETIHHNFGIGIFSAGFVCSKYVATYSGGETGRAHHSPNERSATARGSDQCSLKHQIDARAGDRLLGGR